MDFISSFQKSTLRIINTSRMLFHVSSHIERLVLDMREGKLLPSDTRHQIVSLVKRYPAIRIVVQIDAQTDLDRCLYYLRFAYRLDCSIWVYSYDFIPKMKSEIIDYFVFRKTKIDNIDIPSWFFSDVRASVELTYNHVLGPNIQRIWSQELNSQKSTTLILPDSAIDLPTTEEGWTEWIHNPHIHKKKNGIFARALKKLRAESSVQSVGIQGKETCRIDQVQLILDQRGVYSCPHKPIGSAHTEQIQACTRSCVTPELRMPSILNILYSIERSKLRRRFS